MSKIVVDSSTLISCALNCLLWVFDEFKEKGVKFVVPTEVEREVLTKGLSTKKFRFEAVRVAHHFINNTISIGKEDIEQDTQELLSYANSSFYIKNNPIKILEKADAQVAALSIKTNADAILTDETTLRLLVENPNAIKKTLERRMHSEVKVDKRKLYSFQKKMGNIPVIRSVELLAIALEDPIMFEPTFRRSAEIDISKRDVISGILYALKFSGCSVSFEEINDLVNLVMRSKK
ncbi:MAG TPA: hypothetical protein ENN30_01470 [Candidatus Woesearchaeota archaeon]|nr:hypothetical protein [Candidatus Woesearchaeota archaeon]